MQLCSKYATCFSEKTEAALQALYSSLGNMWQVLTLGGSGDNEQQQQRRQ